VAFAALSPAVAGAAAPEPQKPDKTVEEVVVTGAAPRASIDRRSYSVSGDLQAQTGSISDALRNLPSVEVDVQGNVSLRGDSNVTILIDGKPSSLFQGDNRAQALQSLPANAIDRVEVVTNPSAEFKADGSAGVINLITRKARGAGASGSARLTLGQNGRSMASATVGYNAERLSATAELSARQDAQKQSSFEERRRPGPADSLDVLDLTEVGHIIADSLNGRTSLDYDLTPRLRLGLEAHGGYTYFRPELFTDYASDEGITAEAFRRQVNIHQRRGNLEISADLRRKLGADGELTASLSHEETEDARIRAGRILEGAPAAFDEQRFNNHLRDTELKIDLNRPLGADAKLKLGLDIALDDNSYRNRGFAGTAPDALGPNPALDGLFGFRRIVSAAYGVYERPIGDLTVQAGLRVEDAVIDLAQASGRDRNHETALYPSLHLSWTLSDSEQLKANVSRRIQRPEPGDYNGLRQMLDPLNYRSGDPGLKPQQTEAFELSYERRRDAAALTATAYYRENKDGVADVLRDLGGGVFLTQRANVTRSSSLGLELTTKGKLAPKLSYNFTLTAVRDRMVGAGPGFAPTRAELNLSGRGDLAWQVTDRDLIQLNAFVNRRRLTPQGHIEPSAGLDLGYRRKLNDQLALVFTAQDILGTFHVSRAYEAPDLQGRWRTDFDSRQVRLGLVWTYGGAKTRDPGFEFQGSGPPQ
jgi:outer membrane receptor protein involved in Fe transport